VFSKKKGKSSPHPLIDLLQSFFDYHATSASKRRDGGKKKGRRGKKAFEEEKKRGKKNHMVVLLIFSITHGFLPVALSHNHSVTYSSIITFHC